MANKTHCDICDGLIENIGFARQASGLFVNHMLRDISTSDGRAVRLFAPLKIVLCDADAKPFISVDAETLDVCDVCLNHMAGPVEAMALRQGGPGGMEKLGPRNA